MSTRETIAAQRLAMTPLKFRSPITRLRENADLISREWVAKSTSALGALNACAARVNTSCSG